MSESTDRLTIRCQTGTAGEAAALKDALAPIAGLEAPVDSLRASLDLTAVDSIVIAAFHIAHASMRRDALVRAAHDFDHLLIVICESGRIAATVDSRVIGLTCGDLVVFDLARDFRCDFADLAAGMAIIVPRHRFAIPRGDPGYHGVHFDGAGTAAHLTRQQTAAVLALASAEALTNPAEAASALVASLGVTFAPLTQSRAAIAFDRRDRSLLGKMCRHIDQAIADPKLDVAHLASAFAVSRATVYRMFEGHGGVACYIRNIRLDQAFDQIRRAPHQADRLNVLARQFGFSSGDSFARAFRARFGIRPVQLATGGHDAIRSANRHRRQRGRAAVGVFEGWLLDLAVDKGAMAT